jgi:IS605 OrfB family transposase
MKLTLQTQLLPGADQAKTLKETVERFNEAANWLAGVAFERKVGNKFVLQRIAYQELRERFGLPADTAIRCIGQVIEAYKRDKAKRPKFRGHAAVPFSMGKNIGFKGPDRVSISTLAGRVVVPYIMGKYQVERFGWAKGQCDLVLRRDGKWFLLVTVDVPEGSKPPVTDFIGVDLGVENIATDSDGEIHSSAAIEAKRLKYARRRKAIGRKTKGASRKTRRSCHRAMRRAEKKEAKYRKDINHRISKGLVAKAKDTGRGIALEDLEGIRDRLRFRKPQRARMGGWAFFQLRSFVEYKARLAGVPVALVDPRNTSRTCSACGHCDKASRKSRSEFVCVSCGCSDHADRNAALNIRARASVNAPMAAGTSVGNGGSVQVASPLL